MYTVYDFINNDIEPKHMKTGWKVEAKGNFITLRYTVLNFDWKSLDYLGNDAWNMFLTSKSYESMRAKLDRALSKYGKLYFEATGTIELKTVVEEFGLKVDVGKLIAKTISKKSEKIKEDIAYKEKVK